MVFGVCSKKKAASGAESAHTAKAKAVKKDKDAKTKGVISFDLTQNLDDAPRATRAITAILANAAPSTNFNRVKLVWQPKSKQGGLAASVGKVCHPTIVVSGATAAVQERRPACGVVWSYSMRGLGSEGPATQDSNMKAIKVDGRLPWTFEDSPSWAIVAELWGGKDWLSQKASKDQRDKLRSMGFVCANGNATLAPLPEALASSTVLKQLARKAYAKEHPKEEKAGSAAMRALAVAVAKCVFSLLLRLLAMARLQSRSFV